jgi:biopolymer transport protein ExbD
MKLRRRNRTHSVIEASSLSDILFFLLLFFLMISTLASPNAIRLLLPKASTGKNIPKHTINVSIDKGINYYIEKKQFNYNDLKNAIESEARKHNNASVVLRVDKTVTIDEVVKVIDIVNQLKLQLVVATEKVK